MTRIQDWVLPGPMILAYHRLEDARYDPWSNAVSPGNFAEHLDILRRDFTPLPLGDAVNLHRIGRLPRNAVAITFDDGYVDNLEIVKPLCDRYDTPANIFVVTGMIGATREFYWDQIARVFLEPGTLPSELELEIAGRDYRWSLGSDAEYSADALARNRDYRFGDPIPTRRHQAYVELCGLLEALSDAERDKVCEELSAWSKAPFTGKAARPMNAAELRSLAQGGLIEIGAHSVTHRDFQLLPAQAQFDEVWHSKRALEEITGKQVSGFAYPFGRMDERTVRITRSAGYRYACTTENRALRRSANRFALPRIFVKDWNGEQFARRFAGFARGL